MKRTPTASAVEKAVAVWPGGPDAPADGRYLVGISGGRDSMALLHALLAGGYANLIVCHLEHGIRGEAARADAEFVRWWAESRGLPVVLGHEDVPALAAEKKESLETAARRARQFFFFQTAREHGCNSLFLAHHADDQVETVLFNLCRGTGSRGLGGMLPVSNLNDPASGSMLRIMRPLLGVWRREIDAYITAHSIAYHEDATNADPAHTRNRVRREILPTLFEVFGRGASANIHRAADIVSAEEEWMRQTLQLDEEHAVGSERLSCGWLRERSVAGQRRLLRTWLLAHGASRIGYREVESVRALLAIGEGPAKVNLPGCLHVRRRAGMLFVEASPRAGK